MTVFVDTSAIYAVLDRDDSNHPAAARIWTGLVNDDTHLLTSNYVLLESAALVQHRLGIQALRALEEKMFPMFDVEWIGAAPHRRAMDAVLAAARTKLSLVDCVSFHVMREFGIRTAFCFDKHFREQGFESPADY
ncbi:MAG: PIN domain-containing protein [Bryobacteraceae bacterium]